MRKISILMTILCLLASNHFVQATSIAGTKMESQVEGSEIGPHEELDMEEKLRLLTEIALKHGIPPEILKAIALVESNMMQFKNGEPLITDDGGIGIMQVTNTNLDFDKERLQYDTEYNIEIGAQILKDKWGLQSSGRIPTVNDGNPRILEHWYFAIMAYNGLSAKNDPSKYEHTYQEQVYQELEKYSQLEVSEFPNIQIEYNGNGTMSFPDKHLNWEKAMTESTQMFVHGDDVYVMNSADPNLYNYANIRTEPNLTAAVSSKQAYYTELEIVGGPYIASSSLFNQFVMYEVKGSNFTGYIASSNLRKKTANIEFKQWTEKNSSDTKKKWTIKLNKPLNPETVNPRNVYIINESGDGVFIKLTYHEDDYSIIVEPETPFIVGEKYSLMIKDIRSSSNAQMKDHILMPFSITQ